MTLLLYRLRHVPPYLWLGLFAMGAILGAIVLGLVDLIVPASAQFVWQVVTGSLLFAAISYQWVLLYARLVGTPRQIQRHYTLHRWVGVTAMILFALHAVRFGYAWTHALTIVFCLCALTGLMNREVIRYRSKSLFMVWFWAHITVSGCLVPLVFIHVWVALAFEGH